MKMMKQCRVFKDKINLPQCNSRFIIEKQKIFLGGKIKGGHNIKNWDTSPVKYATRFITGVPCYIWQVFTFMCYQADVDIQLAGTLQIRNYFQKIYWA